MSTTTDIHELVAHEPLVRRLARAALGADPEVDAAPLPASPAPEAVAAREESRRRLLAALMDLPPLYRDALLLRYWEDLPPREVARRLGLPVETARTRLKRGLTKLRETLDERHDGDRRRWVVALLPLAARGRSAAPAALAIGVAVVLLIVAAAFIFEASLHGEQGIARVPARPVEAPAEPSLAALTTSEDGEAEPEKTPADRPLLPDWTQPRVRVVDWRGEGVPGVEITVQNWVLLSWHTVFAKGTTDRDGRVRLGATVAATREQIGTQTRFGVVLTPPEDRDDLLLTSIENWRPGDHTFRMERYRILAGIVKDEAGAPVPGVLVKAEIPAAAREANTYLGWHRKSETDERGAFRIGGLPEGNIPLRVVTAVKERSLGCEAIVTAGRREVVLTLPTAGRLEFRILGLEVEKLPWAHLTELAGPDGPVTDRFLQPPKPDGTLLFHGLRRDHCYTLYMGPFHDDRYALVRAVRPREGVIDLLPEPGATLEALIRLPFDNNAPRVRVKVSSPDIELDYEVPRSRRRVVDGVWEGRLVVTGLPEGTYRVRAESGRNGKADRSAEADVRTGEPGLVR